MGSIIAFISGVVSDAYGVAHKWVGHLPGGLAIGTIGACTGFAACTGSSATSVALMASTALPEMENRKYAQSLSAGTIASGTPLGILIPPSVPLIVYGLLSKQSIGRLFMAGIMPGLLLSSLFILIIVIWAKVNPSAAPAGPKIGWPEKFEALNGN
jgi:TRAP-type C4-dicarboxylate transport system permease large subunit